MHAYATNAKDREFVPAVLAVLAVVAALLFNYLLGVLAWHIPWWLDAPAVMGFYGIFHKMYDAFIWRQEFGPIHLSMLPDIRGTWAGVVTSSYSLGNTVPAILYIEQTWSKLCIQLETTTSRSFSTMAALNTYEAPESGLKYEYLNEPGVFSIDTMQSHRGIAHLHLSSNSKTLDGSFYTGRGRQNIGSLTVHFISKERIEYEEALKLLSHRGSTSGSSIV